MRHRTSFRFGWLALPLLLGLIPSWSLHAQTTTAAIRGVVTDPAGAAVPNTSITVRSRDTGRTYTTKSNDAGAYYLPGLLPGSYSLMAEKEGFRPLVREDIVLTVNQEADINVNFAVGSITQKVVVREAVPLTETQSATISGLVGQKQIIELPLNGRDFYQLALLQPGVAPIAANAFPSPWQDTTNGKLSANGMRPTMNTTILDGAEVSDPGHNQPLGGPSGSALGVDSIREFRVLTDLYTAEFGRNGGVVVQAVTKSGTNAFHGSVYEFLRNEALDAKNFFDRVNEPIPPLHRNQFGFSLGGPIVKDRTFFLVNYEGFRNRQGQTQSFVTPTPAVRVGAATEIVPYLNFYPFPNVPGQLDLGGGVGLFETSAVERTDENYFVIRIDHQFSSRDSLSARYVGDSGSSFKPFMSTPVPGFPGDVDARNHLFALSEQHTFGSRLLNEARFSFSRIGYTQGPDHINPGLSIALGPVERPIGQISVGGVPPLGHALTIPVGQEANVFQLIDHVTYTWGTNVLKAGVDVRRFYVNGLFDLGTNGSYTFFSLPDFLSGNVGFFLGTSATSPDSNRSYRQTNFGTFVEDEYRVTPRLTLNLGLRYEYNSSPSEEHNRLANIRHPLSDSTTTVGDLFDPPKDLFAPRIGLAWLPFGNEKTVVRTGFGLFYDLIKQDIYGDTRWLPPFYQLVLGGFGPGTFRNLAVIIPFGISVPIQFKINQPYSLSYNLQVQREVSPNTLFTLAYVGSRGNHLTRSGEANPNQFSPVTGFNPAGPRLNPNFGSILWIVTDAQSFFNSFQASVQHRYSRGVFFQASYTLSHSVDDASGPFLSDFLSEVGPVQNLFDRKGNRGSSAFDVRHNFVFNTVYELPFGAGKPLASHIGGVAGHLVEGWEIGAILSINSGFPFTVRQADNRSLNGAVFFADRPDIIPGQHCRILGDPAQWFDPSVFQPAPAGFYGNVGRNICEGPNFRNLDFSVLKTTHISERVGVQFRAEFFNIFNHPNFGPPVNTQNPNGQGGNGEAIFAGSTPLTSAGRIFRTVNTSRQIQFGLKLLF